jgi:hypothetical protein
MGCRLLTVDAYPGSVSFYEHLGFTRNLHEAHEGRSNLRVRLAPLTKRGTLLKSVEYTLIWSIKA